MQLRAGWRSNLRQLRLDNLGNQTRNDKWNSNKMGKYLKCSMFSSRKMSAISYCAIRRRSVFFKGFSNDFVFSSWWFWWRSSYIFTVWREEIIFIVTLLVKIRVIEYSSHLVLELSSAQVIGSSNNRVFVYSSDWVFSCQVFESLSVRVIEYSCHWVIELSNVQVIEYSIH